MTYIDNGVRCGGRKPYHAMIPIGARFHELTVTSEPFEDAKGRIRYNVQCDCGTVKSLIGYELHRGRTKSCGCRRKRSKRP